MLQFPRLKALQFQRASIWFQKHQSMVLQILLQFLAGGIAVGCAWVEYSRWLRVRGLYSR